MRLYAEGEDLVPDALKNTAEAIVDRATAGEGCNFDLDDDDKQAIDIVEQGQQNELQKALKAVDFEIEEDLAQEKLKLEKAAADGIEAKRKALRDKLRDAGNDKERRALKDQLKNFDRLQD